MYLLCYNTVMDTEKLIATGLNQQQASAYALLLEHGEISPSEAAQKLKLSRTNGYKALDRLVEMRLAIKKESGKKIVYAPNHPQALSNLVAEQRNVATSREEAVRSVLTDLLAKYHTHNEQPHTDVVTGRNNVAEAYRTQIAQNEPIYFIRSRMDIPVMGFDLMHEIRVAPGRHGLKRSGITPDLSTGTTSNPSSDQRGNLTRTWMKQEDYTAPVEWSVCGSSLLIILFDDEPHAVIIENPLIAEAFRQIWQLLNSCLKQMPYYAQLPRT